MWTNNHVFIADCGQEEDGVEPWIIIVAILGGLILLAIIILVIIRIIIELRVSCDLYNYNVFTTYLLHFLQYCVEFRQWKRESKRARFPTVF